MLPKLPEGPAKLQLKKKIWAIEKELFPKEAAAPPPRRAIEAVAAEALPAPSSRATALLGKYSATAAARRASSDVDIVVPARRVQTEPPASAGTVKASASDILRRYSSSAAARRKDEASQYAAHGYCLLKGWLAADAVEALRDDLKSSRRAHGLDDAALEARDLNVDFIGLSVKDRLEAESTARTEAWAYRRLRRAATSREDGFVSERCVLGALAAAAQQAAGFRRPHLLSEVFVVKPALSKTSFDWHRDDAKQLEKVGGVESTEAFCSTWAPLDDCTLNSGTLELRSKRRTRLKSSNANRATSSSSPRTRGTVVLRMPPMATVRCTTPSSLLHRCYLMRGRSGSRCLVNLPENRSTRRGAEPTRRHSCRASCATLSRNRGRCPMTRFP